MSEVECKVFDEVGGFLDIVDEVVGNIVLMDFFFCFNCGVEIVIDVIIVVIYCYYCYNFVVLLGCLSGEFLLNKVFFFVVEKEEVINRFFVWIKKKWFVLKVFFNKD